MDTIVPIPDHDGYPLRTKKVPGDWLEKSSEARQVLIPEAKRRQTREWI